MKIAYMLQVHKGAGQIKLLVDCLLGDGEDHCFIHVDQKSDKVYRELASYYHHHARVHILDERAKVNWSGFSQVKATLILMKNVYESEIVFDRVQLMSGEDFPIKSSRDINIFFESNIDSEFLSYEEIGFYRWRVGQYNFFTESIHNRTLLIRTIQKGLRVAQSLLPERPMPLNYTPYKGSQWFNITFEATRYILEFIESYPEYCERYRKAACPDEHFFQIILLNSKFKSRIINNNLYYTEWDGVHNSPRYLDRQGVEDAKRRDDILFVRKIDENMAIQLSEGCR